jgi:hypothetical protein
MSEFERVLEDARSASPNERIQMRDAIAAHGRRAIPAMKDWLKDARLGAFAVRVLEAIAKDQANRRAVLDALASTDVGELAAHLARDVSDALGRLGGTLPARTASGTGHAKRSRVEPWPGSRVVTRLELRFHDEMVGVYTAVGDATRRQRPDGTIARGYWPWRTCIRPPAVGQGGHN